MAITNMLAVVNLYILNESKIRPLETTLAGLGSYMSW